MSLCSICGKKFVPYFELSHCRELLISGKTFSICSDCGMKFKNDEELRSILLHSDQSAAKYVEGQINHPGIV